MIKHVSWCLPIFAGVLAAGAGATAAHAKDCIGVLPAGSYDSVNVPTNAFCTINSAVDVTGNVTVGKGATLFVTAPAKFVVNSSLLSTDAKNIDFEVASTVLGNVNVTGTTHLVQFQSSFIAGTLSVANTKTTGASAIDIIGNSVTGSVLLRNNSTSGAGSTLIKGNTIGGSLVCAGNKPLPLSNGGTPNTVGGNEVGDCKNL